MVHRLISRCLAVCGHGCLSLSRSVYQSPQAKRVVPWFRDNGDRTHRLNYDLNGNSLVLDLGGYQGQWASDIFGMYGCEVHVFEPVPQFAGVIRQRFSKNSKIQVHEFGLGDKDAQIEMRLMADGSSTFQAGGEKVLAKMVDAMEFFREHKLQYVDLMKINIEGGEYDLLDRLIAAELISRIRNVQIQFHDFVPDAASRMKQIQEALSRTHKPTYQYEFVWENWEIKA